MLYFYQGTKLKISNWKHLQMTESVLVTIKKFFPETFREVTNFLSLNDNVFNDFGKSRIIQ